MKTPERNIPACGRLWKLPRLWKKAKRYAAFSHSRLDKPSGKTCSPYPQLPQARLRFIPRRTGTTTEGTRRRGLAMGD